MKADFLMKNTTSLCGALFHVRQIAIPGGNGMPHVIMQWLGV
jgi:hypothetical protein